MTRTGVLSEAAMERTIVALRVCAHKRRTRHVAHLRAVATAACRNAVDCVAFHDDTGVAAG